MMLGTTTLPACRITSVSPSSKQTVHVYDWSDECAVTDMGAGPTTITVEGITATDDERYDVIAACGEARLAETNLYFPSETGQSDDSYYRVFTGPAQWTPVSATVYRYSFQAIAVVPYIYSTSTGERLA
jgi:hypothetical protein